MSELNELPWSPTDDAILHALRDAYVLVPTIARVMCRRQRSIEKRLRFLGIEIEEISGKPHQDRNGSSTRTDWELSARAATERLMDAIRESHPERCAA